MNSLWGIHAPNSWDGADLAKLGDVGFTHFVVLHLDARFIPVFRKWSPFGIIEVRFYHGAWWGDYSRTTPLIDPVDWGNFCADEYNRTRYDPEIGEWSMASLGCHVCFDNEINLTEEGGGPGMDMDPLRGRTWYERINDWKLTVRRVVGNRIPVERIHWGALAFGHSDDDNTRGYCGEEICAESVEAYAIKDAHTYWYEMGQETSDYFGHRFVLSRRRFPTKPVFCSEAGNFAVTRETAPDEIVNWYRSLRAFDYVLGGCCFIFRDPTGAHTRNNWGANGEIERRVKAAIAADGAVPTPIPPPDSGGHPVPTPTPSSQVGEYARWSLARIQNNEDPRDVTAFVAHLRALGADYHRPEDYGLPTVKVTVPLAA